MSPPKVKGAKIIQDNLEFLVDAEDGQWASGYQWEVDEKGYIVRYAMVNNKKFRYPLHREVWKRHREAPSRVPITHINGNRGDNRLSNLALCGGAQ
jgi:hypothetical protein